MGKKRRRTPEIRSHLVRLRPGHFRSQSLRQNQYLPITGSSAKQVCRELPSAWKPHLHWNPLGRLALIAHVQHRCGGARSSPPSNIAEQPAASTSSNDIVDGKPVRWSWLVPRPRLCASAQNERADTKSCSNLRTSCPWPSWSSNLHHPHARKLLLPCSRRASWPQALTLRRTREGMQDAHSSVSDRRSSSSAARTLFRRCSTPSCIGRFKFVTSCV